MKSPWKFIAQLTSRRASAKAQDSSTGNDTDPKALESEVEHVSALLPSSNLVDQESSASDEGKGGHSVAQIIRPPIDDAQAHAPARREADNTVGEEPSLVRKYAVSTKSQTKARIKRRERGEKANAQVAAQTPVTAPDRRSMQLPSSRDLFFDEVATLDAEIKMLRSQLAQKLRLQNVQLKKMLERFDVS
ncbi:hypothetical protein [Sinorhizobium meliloti]|uniref:hypothetical protein n=1 Tax=Rhizobium meliloti TaxID=382 RepID=UPI000365F466|nr:hypothetical protein [Sinorhizobium meliloti]